MLTKYVNLVYTVYFSHMAKQAKSVLSNSTKLILQKVKQGYSKLTQQRQLYERKVCISKLLY